MLPFRADSTICEALDLYEASAALLFTNRLWPYEFDSARAKGQAGLGVRSAVENGDQLLAPDKPATYQKRLQEKPASTGIRLPRISAKSSSRADEKVGLYGRRRARARLSANSPKP